MPAKLPDSKNGSSGTEDKLKLIRRPPARISKQRSRSVGGVTANTGGGQLQASRSMIVTMSVSQSGGIALKASGRVAASRTRQLSTASALFDRTGMPIGVVCESTTENREVVMDVINNPINSENNTYNSSRQTIKKTPKKTTLPGGSCFYFLKDDQMEILRKYNVKTFKELLRLNLQQFLTIGFSKEQYELLLLLFEKQIISPNTEKVEIKSIEKEINMDDDDEDDQPLVIDENFITGEEDQPKSLRTKKKTRSLNEIEQCFNAIKNIKIPRSRAVISEVKSELTGLIADLNTSEEKLLSKHMQAEKQLENYANTKTELPKINQEPIISTSKPINCTTKNKINCKKQNIDTCLKCVKTRGTKKLGCRVAKGQVKKNVNKSAPSQEVDLPATELLNVTEKEQKETSSKKIDLEHFPNVEINLCKPKAISQISEGQIDSNSTQPDNLAVENENNIPQPKIAHILVVTPNTNSFSENRDKILNTSTNFNNKHIRLNSMVVNTNILPTLSPVGAKPINLNVTATVLKFTKCGVIFINPLAITTKPIQSCEPVKDPEHLKPPEQFDSETNLSKNHTNDFKPCSNNSSSFNIELNYTTDNLEAETHKNDLLQKESAQSTSETICKNLTPFSADVPTGPNFQPTVMLKKLPPILRMQENVDADSTTTSFEVGGCKGKKPAVSQLKKQLQAKLERKNQATDPDGVPPFQDQKVASVADVVKIADPIKNVAKDMSVGLTIETEQKNVGCSDSSLNSPELLKSDIVRHSKSTKHDNALPKSPEEHVYSSETEADDSFIGGCGTRDSLECLSPEDMQDWSEKINSEETGSDILSKKNNATCKNSEKCVNNNILEKECSSQDEVENRKGRLTAQRRIDFDSKFGERKSFEYDCDDIDAIAAMASTPLSPISCGIASPTNARANLNDYTPAMEIDGHMSYPAPLYLLHEIDVPGVIVNKPDDLNILLRSNITDPRLSKFNTKSLTDGQTSIPLSTPVKVTSGDPRRSGNIFSADLIVQHRQKPTVQQTPNMLLYGCLQRSPWYQSLMSTMKIQINQTISVLVRAMNNFQKIRLEDPYAIFDIFKLDCAGELLEILENLGLFIDVNGIISEKKNLSSFAGRSYGCSSIVNSTYSFIQPVEPSSVTVQHQHMSSYTGAQTQFQSPPPFISCYIDSPPLSAKKAEPVKSLQLQSMPRRHCGLKAPYAAITGNRSPVLNSPAKRQMKYSDSEEESWDLEDEVTPSKSKIKYERSHRKYSYSERSTINSRAHDRGKFYTPRRRY